MNLLVLAANPGGADNIFDLNGLLSGGVGTAIVLGVVYVVRIIADRTIPSRSDKRGDLSLALETLNNTIKILQDERRADSERLTAKQGRIDELEKSADADFDRIREMRNDILDLTGRLEQKERNIAFLVEELRKLGAQVSGLDLDSIEVTHSTEEVRRIRKGVLDAEAEAPQKR